MLPDGSFGIGLPQLVNIGFSPSKNTVARDLKRLLGERFNPSKMATEIARAKVNVITLQEFELVLIALDRAGNESARAFRDELVGLSLHQLFSDAFGIKFAEEDRQQWLLSRQKARKQHQPLVTDHWAHVDGCCDRREYIIRTAQLKKACLLGMAKVDNMTQEQLLCWTEAQQVYDNARRIQKFNHKKAIEAVACKQTYWQKINK